MTQSQLNGNGPATRDTGELLDQLCGHALRLLSGAPSPPRSLNLRAGDVSVEVELAGGEAVVTAPVAPVPAPEPAEAPGTYLTAQNVGVFYRAPEPGADPFVSEGDEVREGQQIGIIEAMKLMIPVEADRAGRIIEVLKDDAEAVEYGEKLFAIEAI
jgi:acetyl-CoA carboxylase biotin carboxyl carrier protein